MHELHTREARMTPHERETASLRAALDRAQSQRDLAVGLALGFLAVAIFAIKQ